MIRSFFLKIGSLIWICACLSVCTTFTGCSKTEKTISSFADAKDAAIGVMTGGTGEQLALKRFPSANIKGFDSVMDALSALKSHQLDAVLTIYPIALNLIKQDPGYWYLQEPVELEETAIAVKKNNDILYTAVDNVISDLKRDGTMEDMKKRWFKMESTPYDEVAISLPKEGDILKIGVCASLEPFCFMGADQKITGHECELARRIAAKLNRPIKFLDMKISALLPALQSGKIDLIVTGMIATEERRKLVDFTQSYFANAYVLLVKKPTDIPAGYNGPKQGAISNIASFFQRVAESFHNNIILENRYLLIFKGLANTILISILSTVFGTLLGALICFLRMSNRKILSALARTYISILRGTPVLVLLMIIFYIVFASVNIDPILVAVVAFGMNFAAYVSEMFRTGIESVDRGQSEAGTAMGFTGIGTFNYIVLPQALKYILPVYKGEFISLVKMTSVVGYIAVQDLTKAGDIIRSRTFDAFFPLIMVAVIYLSISWLLTLSLGYLEAAVDTKSRRKKIRV